MTHRCLRAFLWCALLCLSFSAWAQSPTFKILANPTTFAPWENYALSHDGKVMAANYGGAIYRWTSDTPEFPGGGFSFLDPGNFLSASVGISSDGSTIVASRLGPDGYLNPAVWNERTGWIDLGHPANGCLLDNQWGFGWALNGNGTVAVGLAWYCPGGEAFTWSQQQGMKTLSHPHGPYGTSSRASAISADGKTIVGFSEDPQHGVRRAVRWFGGKTYLFTGDHTAGEATAVSSDGSQIVGQVALTGWGKAFYHTETGGLVSMGTISGLDTDQSIANSVADNGMAVGWSGDPFGSGIQAFIWSPKMRMQSLKSYLNRRGVIIPYGISLTTALAISADGSTIVGLWQDANFTQGGWMVRLRK